MGLDPARVYVDVSALVRRLSASHPLTGTDRVALEYARWAAAVGGGLCIRRGERLVSLPPSLWPTQIRPGYGGWEAPGEGVPIRERWNAFPRGVALLHEDGIQAESLVLDPSHDWLERPRLWSWIRHSRISTAVLVHDMLPIELPEFFVEGLGARHEARLRSGLRHASAIITNSRSTEASLRRWAQGAGLQVPPLVVAPLGHRPFSDPVEGSSLPLTPPYFVTVGTIEPRKNHLLLLNLWRHLARRGAPPPPRLVILGRRGWECEQVLDILDRSAIVRPHLLEINTADDAQVAALLRGARALLMPSFSEGFGMPVQEALALGTPVISSPLPSVQEFAGSIPEYAEPYDGARWLQLIDDYKQEDSPLRAGQLERLAFFQTFSWPDHFRRVVGFLESLGESQRS